MKDKIIQKLMKKAKPIEKVEINPENLLELDLEAFYKAHKKKKSDLYYKDNKIYKKAKNGWYMVRIGVDLKEIVQDLKELTQRIVDLEKWTHNIKTYIDDNKG